MGRYLWKLFFMILEYNFLRVRLMYFFIERDWIMILGMLVVGIRFIFSGNWEFKYLLRINYVLNY